ncbi:hypothetical protein TIFTF001_010338 [Ficus carica]|uniref:Uncharacterized protein n=1 Tax=Ficus carica TaxID=3494 RepID=A0AA87ZPY0_FICCA|nr:hypothetical protein TIFTF001_010338 [Ficus carica]
MQKTSTFSFKYPKPCFKTCLTFMFKYPKLHFEYTCWGPPVCCFSPLVLITRFVVDAFLLKVPPDHHNNPRCILGTGLGL